MRQDGIKHDPDEQIKIADIEKYMFDNFVLKTLCKAIHFVEPM